MSRTNPHALHKPVILPGPRTRARHGLLCLALLLSGVPAAHAHVGSKDVFEQVDAGPYRLFVTIRPPTVIPGVATVEVRTSGPAVTALSVTPVPLTGEAARHPPTPDALKRSAADPGFFTGSLWLMAPGSWQVRFAISGAAGNATAGVPVPAMPLSILPMQRPLGFALALLGLVLAIGIVGIIAAAVRESRLAPGVAPDPTRRRRGLIAGAAAAAVVSFFLWGGKSWWNVEAAGYASAVYQPLTLTPSLSGNTLTLHIRPYAAGVGRERRSRSNTDLMPDHGQLMHLYAIRSPGMDAAFHLHPHLVSAGDGDLQLALPAMPPGTYRLFADIVHANGFPETLTASLTVPPGLSAAPLAPDDASAFPSPLRAVAAPEPTKARPLSSAAVLGGTLGPAYKLPDGYTMLWDRPAALTANTACLFRFHLLDSAGHPATDMQPYLGMAGHAAFVKTDGTTFAHTHPDGSAAMPAMMLANPGSAMPVMAGMGEAGPAVTASPAVPIAPVVDFPYGFPGPGHYRLFIQMKHAGSVETGVFDADVR